MAQSDLLERNLLSVFNERDPQRRIAAVSELYTVNAVMYEPENIVTGQTAISSTVGTFLGSLPPGFRFAPRGAAVGHHDIIGLRWTGSIPDGTVIVTGTDVAHLHGGRIASLYVLIDPPNGQTGE